MKRNDISDISNKITFQNYENLFNVYEGEDGLYYYNISRTINIPKNIQRRYYNTYQVQVGDTWTGISYKFYEDVRLWWTICIANGVMNPLQHPTPGYIIKILNIELIQHILTEIRDN